MLTMLFLIGSYNSDSNNKGYYPHITRNRLMNVKLKDDDVLRTFFFLLLCWMLLI